MNTRQAAVCGGSIGFLIAFAIAMLMRLDIVDAAWRAAILTCGGAWMGALLAWLNDLLPDPHRRDEQERRL